MISEGNGAENVGGQALLSVLLLESLLPEGWGELQEPIWGPRAQEAEEVAEVGPGVDGVELAAGQERDEDGVDARALVAAEEEPVFPAEDLATEVALGDIIVQGQTPVGHEAAEGDALVASVAECLRDRRTVEGDDGLLVAPLEERVEERLRLLAPDLLALLSRRRLDRALDAKEPLDQREGVFGELGVGGERLEEVPPGVGPTSARKSLGKEEEIRNLSERSRGFNSPAVKASSQPGASLAWRAATYVLKRRQRVLMPCDRASISYAAEVFVLLETGTAFSGPLCEDRRARPGSENRAKAQDGSYRNLGDPVVATCEMPHWSTAPERTWLMQRAPAAWERTLEQHVEPGNEFISVRVSATGSRSALVVPLKLGNSAHGDPVEGRGASCWQNRVWETRRTL